MAEITKFPATFRHRSTLDYQERMSQPEPSEAMIWELCLYVRAHQSESQCRHCPEWEDDPSHGKVQRMCRGLARARA